VQAALVAPPAAAAGRHVSNLQALPARACVRAQRAPRLRQHHPSPLALCRQNGAQGGAAPLRPAPASARAQETARRVCGDAGLAAERKAYLMQNIMASRYIVAQQRRLADSGAGAGAGAGPGGGPARTYHDAARGVLGCAHYQRRCHVVAPCCGQVHACRFCHDEVADHRLDPHAVTAMVCMACSARQPAAAACRSCGQAMARYYCGICHLWDDEPARAIYHCPFCNLCRRGRGLGVDACHCMDCNSCMHLDEFARHKCRDLSACPVCTDYLFDSAQPYRARRPPLPPPCGPPAVPPAAWRCAALHFPAAALWRRPAGSHGACSTLAACCLPPAACCMLPAQAAMGGCSGQERALRCGDAADRRCTGLRTWQSLPGWPP